MDCQVSEYKARVIKHFNAVFMLPTATMCVYVIMALFMNLWSWMVWNIFLESFCCASKHVPFVFIALKWHLVGLIGF